VAPVDADLAAVAVAKTVVAPSVGTAVVVQKAVQVAEVEKDTRCHTFVALATLEVRCTNSN